jgi:3-isopropylmalate/(R)-2-methylmalate dehydratase small subunit
LHEFGIRAVIAPSFAPIFFGNCVRNGIVPVRLAEAAVAALAGHAGTDPQANTITVDLEAREVRAGTTQRFAFDIDAESRDMLLEGLDAIDLTLKSRKEIAAFVERDRVARPWIYSGAVVE